MKRILLLSVFALLVINACGEDKPRSPFAPLLAPAANPAGNLDQCANGPLSTPVNCTASGDWVNGNLGASKAHYLEGNSVPYRVVFSGLNGTLDSVTIKWDITKSGKHAIDYLTSFDRTVAANPCAGVSTCGSPSTFDIPVDTQVSHHGVTAVAGVFTLYGGTITSVSDYTYPDGAGFTGDKSTAITIRFTSTALTPVLAWGGHIATRADWGLSNAAVNIPGSPYHMHVTEVDGKGGDQDRSLDAAAIIFPGSITIIKDAVPNDTQDFAFTTTGGLVPASFTLDDDNDPTLLNTQVFSNILTFGTYTITEGSVAGWTLSFGNPVCTVTSANGGSQTADVPSRTLTITLAEGENVTCTFTNSTAMLTVTKTLQPSNDPGKFNLQIDGVTEASDVGDQGTTGARVVGIGTHSVGEVAGTGTALGNYTAVIGGDCATNGSITMGVGDSKTCTITNTRNQGTIELVKAWVGTAGQTTLDIGTTAGGTDVASQQTGPNGTAPLTTGAKTVNTGTYFVSETGGLSDYAAGLECTDNGSPVTPGTDNAVSVATGHAVVCTFTNSKLAQLTVQKVITGGGSQSFDFSRNPGNATFSLTDGQSNSSGFSLTPGTYTVCESNLPAGWSTSVTVDGSPVTTVNPDAPQDNGVRCATVSLVYGDDKTMLWTNTPPPGGQARTIGYWKNWSSCTAGGQYARAVANGEAGQTLDANLPQQIGKLSVSTCAIGVAILDKRDVVSGQKMANDAAYGLAAQLLAAELNVSASAATCPAATTAISSAQALLVKIGFTGTGSYLRPFNGADYTSANSIAATLDAYNNNTLCP